jgi:hypothetical protein
MKLRADKILQQLLKLYIVALPFYNFSLWNVGTRSVLRVDWLAAFILIAVFIALGVLGHVSIRRSPINKIVILYFFIAFMSMINLWDASNAQYVDFASKFLQMILMIVVYFVISSIKLDDDALKQLLRLWFATAFIISLYGIYQLFARPLQLPLAELTLTNVSVAAEGAQTYRVSSNGFAQISSVFKEPGWLGTYLLSSVILFGVIILNKRDSQLLYDSKAKNRLMWGVQLLALLLTGALGPILFLFLSLSALLLFGAIPRVRLTRYVVILSIFLGLVFFSLQAFEIEYWDFAQRRLLGLYDNIIDPYGSAEITSFQNRQDRTLAAIQVWLERPVLGVGLNQVEYYNWRYVQEEESTGFVNNGWASLLAELGFLGFMIVFIWVAATAFHLGLLARSAKPDHWWHVLLVGMMWLVLVEAADSVIAFNQINHPLRWFTLSFANLVIIEAQNRMSKPQDAKKTAFQSSDAGGVRPKVLSLNPDTGRISNRAF